MTPSVTIAIILFCVTLLTYCIWIPSQLFGLRLRPHALRVIAITILVNCGAQIHLLNHGYNTCTLVFLGVSALEAILAGLLNECFYDIARRLLRGETPDGIHIENIKYHSYQDLSAVRSPMDLEPGQVIAEMNTDELSVVLRSAKDNGGSRFTLTVTNTKKDEPIDSQDVDAAGMNPDEVRDLLFDITVGYLNETRQTTKR